nr:uncharacterized protein LOC109738882 [Aegilops tauschii subsp. strangulata]
MAVVIRYVDTHGLSNERFVGVLHVEETTSAYLKSKIDFIIAKLGLSLQQVRGQGYDGASNMAALTNGLSKTFQRKDMDIVNAISDVESAKRELDKLRSEHGWSSLLSKFSHYDDEKLMKLAKFYPNDFSDNELDYLEKELCLYIDNLVLTLPVATATVERCFSAMKLVKNALRNKMGDDYLSNSLICFVEKEMLDTIPNELEG